MISIVNVPTVANQYARTFDLPWLRQLAWHLLWAEDGLEHHRVNLPHADQCWRLIKCTAPTQAAAARRLEQEFALAEKLQPAWSLRPLALLSTADGPFLVLADCAGQALHEAIGDGFPIERFLQLAAGAAHALAQAHAHGLLHRDIKPCHLIAGADGIVRLTGFGLSVDRAAAACEPQSQSICGTLAYMSPEQARCVDRQADERSDLYALGMTFYEWLAGQLPFQAEDAVEWVYCHVARQAPPLTQFRGDLPAPLAHLIEKLIAKNPDDRYQDATTLHLDLRECLHQWRQFQDIPNFVSRDNEPRGTLSSPVLTRVIQAPIAVSGAMTSISIAGGRDTLDLASVMKAAQALCEETAPQRLIEILMSTTIVQAGAQRALLVLLKDEVPMIRATGQVAARGIEIELVDVAPGNASLPLSILDRVLSTRQRWVADDMDRDRCFATDEYLKQHTVRSVLCLPLIKQRQLIGVLYLENNLAPGVFTAHRTAVLELLASQAAISLETARLHQQLQEENARRKDTENALRNARAELARVSQATVMGELAASIAHEINQPLASMVSNAAASLRWLNRETPVLDEALAGLRDIVNEGRRAGEIVNALQSLARQGPQHRRGVQINDVIRHVVALTQNEVEQHRVLMTTHLTRSPLQVNASSVQLQQVMLNLILNALDAMSAGDQVLRRLAISSQWVAGHYVAISVEDTGPGIDAANLDNVFNAFFTTKDKGMGMGLAICRSIIHDHGGQLHAMPARYGGTTLVFTLPVKGSV